VYWYCRSESSLSHAASGSTSASNGLADNASSSLSSILHGPTGTGTHHRLAIGESGRPRNYSPLTRRALTLREATDQLAKSSMRQSASAAGTATSTSGSDVTSVRMREGRHSAVAVAVQHRSSSPTDNRRASPVRQSYLYRLISDARKVASRSDVDASASNVSSIVEYKPSTLDQYTVSGRGRHAAQPASIQRSDHTSTDEMSLPMPSRGRQHASRLYTSPFLNGTFQSQSHSNASQQLPVKSFDYKAFHHTGSWLENRTAGSLGSKTASLGDKRRLAADNGGRTTGMDATGRPAGRSVAADDRRLTTGNAETLSVSVSGVKPASHHEPCRHTYVSCLSICLSRVRVRVNPNQQVIWSLVNTVDTRM